MVQARRKRNLSLAEREAQWRRLYPEAFAEQPQKPTFVKKAKRRHHQGRNRHHLHPKSRGGSNLLSNLLLIDIERHKAWHAMFGNATADEVLDLLTRVVRAKRRQAA